MQSLSIGNVARITGLRASTLRYYETVGILPRPARIRGRRLYDGSIVRQIDLVRFAQQAGFTLQDIKTLLRGFGDETPLSSRWRTLAHKKLKELDLLTKRIEAMRKALKMGLKCGCIGAEDCKLALKMSDARARPQLPGGGTPC